MSRLRRILGTLHLLGPASVAKQRADRLVEQSRRAVDAARSTDATAAPSGHPAADFWDHASTNPYYDTLTTAVIRRVVGPDDMAIDIGAHVGDVLLHMVAAAPGVEHLAVEPLPHLAAGLRTRFPTVRVEEVALVDQPSGPLQFHHVETNPGYSGIRQRSFDRPDEKVELIEVQTARLDDLVGPDRSPALVKLDVEGAELGVLRGAQRLLREARPIVVFEHGVGAANHYDTTPRAVHDLFASHNYQVFLLGTWLEHGPPLSRDQFVDQYEQQRNYYFLAAPV